MWRLRSTRSGTAGLLSRHTRLSFFTPRGIALLSSSASGGSAAATAAAQTASHALVASKAFAPRTLPRHNPAENAKFREARWQKREQKRRAMELAAAATTATAAKPPGSDPAATAPSISTSAPSNSAASSRESDASVTPQPLLRDFWAAANNFLMSGEVGGGRVRRTVAAEAAGHDGGSEARWRLEALAVLQADIKDSFETTTQAHAIVDPRNLRRPSETELRRLEQRYAELLRIYLPQFDHAASFTLSPLLSSLSPSARRSISADADEIVLEPQPPSEQQKQQLLNEVRRRAMQSMVNGGAAATAAATASPNNKGGSQPPQDQQQSPAEPQSDAITFEQYAGITQAMLRLTTENPPMHVRARDYRRLSKSALDASSTSSSSSSSSSSSADGLSDPQYPLRLLSRYWSSLSSPASPFSSSYAPRLGWWKMMAALHVLVGCAARPAPDRLAIVQGVVQRMKQERATDSFAGQTNNPTATSTPTNLYEQCIKHDAFFRALLFAAVHTGDLLFAASLLPQIHNLYMPQKAPAPSASSPSGDSNSSPSGSNVTWRPIPRLDQVHMYDQFLARCCAQLHLQHQSRLRHSHSSSSSLASSAAAAASASTPLEVAPGTIHAFATRTLMDLFPAMRDVVKLTAQQEKILGQSKAQTSLNGAVPPVLAYTSSSSASTTTTTTTTSPVATAAATTTTSMLDLLYHGFRSQIAGGLFPSIRVYNFLLYGLTHTETSSSLSPSNESLPSEESVHALLTEMLQTVVREQVTQLNLTSFHLLLEFCLRDASSSSSSAILSLNKLALLEFTLEHFQTFLARELSKGEEFAPTLDPTAALLLAQACYARTRATAAAATTAATTADPTAQTDNSSIGNTVDHAVLAQSLVEFHASWSPLLSDMPVGISVEERRLASVESLAASETPRRTWARTVLVQLCALSGGGLGSPEALKGFLGNFSHNLLVPDMQAALRTVAMATSSAQPLFEAVDQWMRESAGAGETAKTEDLQTAKASTAATAAKPSAAPSSPSSSMAVSDVLLRWEQAKLGLSPSERQALKLPLRSSPSPPFGAVATMLSAAKYVIFHSRKMQLESAAASSSGSGSGDAADAPLTLPSFYSFSDPDLPKAVSSAANFSTGWLLLCCGWVQHYGPNKATKMILHVLTIVAKAATGNNQWNTEFVEKQQQQQRVNNSQPAPSSSTSSPSSSDDVPVSVSSPTTIAKDNSVLSRTLGWVVNLGQHLVSDFSTSLHIFTPVPPSTPLLETDIPFKLHPQLLHSILYSFESLPEYATAATATTTWLKLFNHFDRFLPLFDLTHHDPILVKLFHCGNFRFVLRRLQSVPSSTWPALMSDLARHYDARASTAQRHRVRTMLQFFIANTRGRNTAIAPPATSIPEEGEAAPQPQQLEVKQLLQCMAPFFKRMQLKGAAGEMREWVRLLDASFPNQFEYLWAYIDDCVARNDVVVAELSTPRIPESAQLESSGLLPSQEAHAWKRSLIQQLGGRVPARRQTVRSES